MINTCTPPEGAEDGSLHWVEHPDWGKRVWAWNTGRWEPVYWPVWPMDVCGNGWRYLRPASPTADTELADARAEIARLRNGVRALGAYLHTKGEAFRCGEGAELLDAYEASLHPSLRGIWPAREKSGG